MSYYFIRDNNGCYTMAQFYGMIPDDNGKMEWMYHASAKATHGHGDINLAKAHLDMLNEINEVCQLGLTWELIEGEFSTMPVIADENTYLFKPVTHGQRKVYIDIVKKFKKIFAEIEYAYNYGSFVVIDEKGNYASERSFYKMSRDRSRWLYSSFTGRCADFRWYPSKRYAESIKAQLEATAKKIGMSLRFEVVKVNLDEIVSVGGAVCL